MRKVSFWMVLLAVLAVSSVVFAQRGPGGPGGPGGGPGGPGGPGGGPPMMMGGGGGLGMFIRSPEMREAIGLNDDQIKQLESAMQAARPNFQRPGGGPPSPEDMARIREEMTKMQEEFTAKAEKIVTPEQMGKAKTIAFQAMGGLDGNAPPQGGPGGGPRMSALDSDFAMGALNLTASQKQSLKAAQDKFQETRRSMFQGFQGGNRPSQDEIDKMRAKMEDANKAMKTEIESLLTADQKSLAKKLVDETPEFIRQAQQRRQQGGPGGPGGPEGQPRNDYRPGSESWQPGQGGGQRPGGRPGGGGGFPTGE